MTKAHNTVINIYKMNSSYRYEFKLNDIVYWGQGYETKELASQYAVYKLQSLF